MAGIFIAWQLWVRRPERAGRELQARFRALHGFFSNKWYFDEAIDATIVRPVAWIGPVRQLDDRARRSSTASGRRHEPASCAPPRPRCARVQTGYLRYYAALLLVGVTGLGAYFLISA